jgi:hypothetical protein
MQAQENLQNNYSQRVAVVFEFSLSAYNSFKLRLGDMA